MNEGNVFKVRGMRDTAVGDFCDSGQKWPFAECTVVIETKHAIALDSHSLWRERPFRNYLLVSKYVGLAPGPDVPSVVSPVLLAITCVPSLRLGAPDLVYIEREPTGSPSSS